MISYRIKIPRLLRGLLTAPERNILKMFGVKQVNSHLPSIMRKMIQRNFKAMENSDGSSWEPWSETTEKFRAKKIARLKPKKSAVDSVTMMIASGEYYSDLMGLDFSEMKLNTMSELWHSNNSAILFLDTDDIPQLWNEFGRNRTAGAIKSSLSVPKREVLYFDEQGIDNIIDIVTDSLDKYWA